VRHRPRIALAIGAAIVVALPASPASAGPILPAPTGARSIVTTDDDLYRVRGVTPQTLDLMRRQEKLERLIDRIRAAAPPTAGLAGVAIDPLRDTLRLAWKGALPAAVAKEVEAARADGLTVAVRPAPYTEAQLAAEAARMSRAPLWAGPRTGQRVMQVSPRPDGTGITVGIGGLPAGTTVAEARRIVPALAGATVPLEISFVPPPAFTLRGWDMPAHWGGAYIERWVNGSRAGNSCSDAFGVTGNNGAATYLLTAAHCGEGEWRSVRVQWPDGTQAQISYGNTIPAGRAPTLDAALILAPLGAGNAVYYGESINLDTGSFGSNTGITVGGTEGNPVGAFVCTSGAYSGTICNIQIVLTNVSFTYDPPSNGVGPVTNMVLATKVNDGSGILAAVGEGDSGGPVFSILSQRARARGVISGQRNGSGWTAPCHGWAPPGRDCSNSVWFGDIRTIVNRVGVRMNTG
jgi:streptogrisin D